MNITRLIIIFVIMIFIVTVIIPDNCEALPHNRKHKSGKKGKKNSSNKPDKLHKMSKQAGSKLGKTLASRVNPYIEKFLNMFEVTSNNNGAKNVKASKPRN